jgi:hypothetical protein
MDIKNLRDHLESSFYDTPPSPDEIAAEETHVPEDE